jgi:hypothetical protein
MMLSRAMAIMANARFMIIGFLMVNNLDDVL